MKLLIIDKTAGVLASQAKFLELRKLPDIQLGVLTPSNWRENYTDIHFQAKIDSSVQWFTGAVMSPGYCNRAFYVSGLNSSIQSFKPDVILLMEEPFSLFALQAVFVSRLLAPNAKIIFYTWHNYSYYPYKLSAVYHLINRFVMHNTDYGIAANPEALSILKQKGFNKPSSIIPYGVDVEGFTSTCKTSAKEKLNVQGFVVGYVGRLIEAKGIFNLVDAVSKLESSTLVLIGDGPCRQDLLEYAKQKKISSRIVWLGVLDTKELYTAMNACDTLVLPSKTTTAWKEQFGRVLIEAMAAHVPVIGSSSGAIPWVIGDAGLVFQEGNTDDLLEKLKLLRDDYHLRASLADRGFQRVNQEFTWQCFAERISDVIETVVSLEA